MSPHSTTIRIRARRPQDLSEAELEAMVRQQLALDHELGKDDPPRLPADVAGMLRRGWGPPWTQGYALAWEGEQLLGQATWSRDTVTNPDVLWLDAVVDPAWRRQGLARRLLSACLREVEAEAGRMRTLNFSLAPTRSAIGAQLRRQVEEAWGLKTALLERRSRLDLRAVDRPQVAADLARRWAALRQDFDLVFFPMADLESVADRLDAAAFVEAVNEIEGLMPLDGLDQVPETFDRARLDAQAALQAARGRLLWNLAVVERATGRCAGYTNISFKPDHPALVSQWGTGVVSACQGRSLGKLLKLAMLDRVLEQLPGARFIETNNAAINASMIAINDSLGFREFTLCPCYQADRDVLSGWLGLG